MDFGVKGTGFGLGLPELDAGLARKAVQPWASYLNPCKHRILISDPKTAAVTASQSRQEDCVQ